MLDRSKLVNLIVFLERAAEGGAIKSAGDAHAFVETLQAVHNEIQKIDNPLKELTQ